MGAIVNLSWWLVVALVPVVWLFLPSSSGEGVLAFLGDGSALGSFGGGDLTLGKLKRVNVACVSDIL